MILTRFGDVSLIYGATQNVNLSQTVGGFKLIQKIPAIHFWHIEIKEQEIGLDVMYLFQCSFCTLILVKLTWLLDVFGNKFFSHESAYWIVIYEYNS